MIKLLNYYGLTLNGPKCIFMSKEIPFWGTRFSSDGIKPCPEKCKAVQNMSPPSCKEDIPSFLSLLQSNSRFIPLFSKLTSNIQKLQKKNCKFQWNAIHQCEFDKIKEVLGKQLHWPFLTLLNLRGYL